MTIEHDPMSAVDRAWFRMESVESPMMISAVLTFDESISRTRLRRLLEQRFLCFQRFRQRVIDRGYGLQWEEDPLFDIDNHLHSLALPGKGTKTDLQNLASDMNSTPLNLQRPLWQIHYIDGYNGGCALLVRIHHCIADGISLVRVLLSLTDSTPNGTVHNLRTGKHRPRERQRPSTRMLHRLSGNARIAVQQSQLFIRSVLKEPGYPLKLARTAGAIAMDLAKLGLAPFEPQTGLKTPLSGRKQVAWAEPIPLADVKDCSRALRGTTNDVLMCAATGALNRHFIERGEVIPECGIRVAVPFNLRPLRQPIETLGNQFGLVLVSLPVEVADPLMRFRQVQENMNRLKRSYQAQVTYSLLDIFGRGPDMLERRALKLLSSKASAVLTNVPGPKQPVYLAGAKLAQPMFWVPQSGDIGIGISIFSYAGHVQFGITVDKSIQADPTAVMGYFRDSFFELHQLALSKAQQQAV